MKIKLFADVYIYIFFLSLNSLYYLALFILYHENIVLCTLKLGLILNSLNVGFQ